jgi:hypothetical protein
LESEAKKRLRLHEMKDYYRGKKCLSPSIFKKTKGPLIIGSTNSSVATSASSDSMLKSLQSGGKKSDQFGLIKDFTQSDFDLN